MQKFSTKLRSSIAQQRFAVIAGENAFGVKLHAFYGQFFSAKLQRASSEPVHAAVLSG